eukprot:c19405_g1_i1 orf=1-1011(-)
MKDLKCCFTGTRCFSAASADRLDCVFWSTSERSSIKVGSLSTDPSAIPDKLVGAHQEAPRRSSLSHAEQVLSSSKTGFDCQGTDPSQSSDKLLGAHQEACRRPSLSHTLSSSKSGLDCQRKACSPSKLLLDIQGFCKQGHLDRALAALSLLEPRGLTPPEDLYWSLLKACNKQKALSQAKQVHGFLARHGKGLSSSLFDYLVSTLAKCGGLEEALDVFHQLCHRTVFSWTAVISAYTEGGKGEQAMETYRHMQVEGIQPNEHTIVSLLKACGSISDLEQGKAIHAYASTKGLDAHDFIGSALVSMYGKCTSIMEAEKVFDSLSKCNVVLWNAMLSAY